MPVTAATNGAFSRAYTCASVRAVTLAVRGTSRSRAISPTPWPRPTVLTWRPSTETSSVPPAIA